MYTRQSASVRDAASQAGGPSVAADMTQALANCAAPMAHRGEVAFNGRKFPNQGGVMWPYGNGGGMSGVSRAGPGMGAGQMLRGGVFVIDGTQRVPPWGVDGGVGSGRTFPTSSFYGGDYYGADAFNVDYGSGSPTSVYLTYLNNGGDYYGGDTFYGAGDSIFNTAEYRSGDVFLDIANEGGTYNSEWHTVNNNVFNNFPGPTVTNYSTYNYGGPTFVVEGDTVLNNVVVGASGSGRGGRDGVDGADGLPGDPSLAGSGGPAGRPGDPGRDGLIFVAGAGGDGQRVIDLFQVDSVQAELNLVQKQVVTHASFNPDTCFVDLTVETVTVLANPQRPFKKGPTVVFAKAPVRVFAP